MNRLSLCLYVAFLKVWRQMLANEVARLRYQIDTTPVDNLFDPDIDQLRALKRHDVQRIACLDQAIDRLQLGLGST